jgi:DNA helicase II / ATP-dependent DNA helicase PcrA
MSSWLEGLNPEQQEAVQHVHGPLLILAGAGSGKTTVLIARSGYLIDNQFCKPSQIQVLTFTNKAARELMTRVRSRLGPQAKGLKAGTFHSFGLKFLRRYHDHFGYPSHFGVLDQNDALGLMRELAKSLSIVGRDQFDFEQVYQLVLEYRIFGRAKSVATEEYMSLAEWMHPKYMKALEHLAVVDFEDLILKPIELLKKYPQIQQDLYQETLFWMVDEFQDTNDAQMKLLHHLVNPQAPHLTVVGDDDQAIYGFRGAMVRHILNFPQEFPQARMISLERNYRSTAAILALANRVILENKERHDKILKPESGYQENILPELFVLETEVEEAEWILKEVQSLKKRGVSLSQIAILYRANSQSQLIEAEFKSHQIPYRVTGGISLFDRKEIKDMAAYFKLMIQYHELSCRRIVNMPPRGIGELSLDKILAFMQKKTGKSLSCSFLEGLKSWELAGVEPRVGLAIETFVTLYEQLEILIQEWDQMEEVSSYSELFLSFFRKIGFIEYFLNSSPQRVSSGKVSTEEMTFDKKLTPIHIFLNSLDRYIRKQKIENSQTSLREIIKGYLEFFELKDDGEDRLDSLEQVQMMTLHASKGLEFEHVFLPGLEEDLLPHKVLGLDTHEERRLFYVGITRAKKRLYLSRAQTRKRYGAQRPVAPSRFIQDLPESVLKSYQQGVRPVEAKNLDSVISHFMKSLEQKNLDSKKGKIGLK